MEKSKSSRQSQAHSLAWAALVELDDDELRRVAGGEQSEPTADPSGFQPLDASAAKKPGDLALHF